MIYICNVYSSSNHLFSLCQTRTIIHPALRLTESVLHLTKNQTLLWDHTIKEGKETIDQEHSKNPYPASIVPVSAASFETLARSKSVRV